MVGNAANKVAVKMYQVIEHRARKYIDPATSRTTIATCKKQHQNAFEFIHNSLIAYWTNNSYPELL